MKKVTVIFYCLSLFLFSCGNDDGMSCQTCSSSLTPDFIVCNENGNASVNGEDTGTSFSVYIANLEENEGTTCN